MDAISPHQMTISVLEGTVTNNVDTISATELTASASRSNVSDNIDVISTNANVIRDNMDMISPVGLKISALEPNFCEDIAMISTTGLEISALKANISACRTTAVRHACDRQECRYSPLTLHAAVGVRIGDGSRRGYQRSIWAALILAKVGCA